MRTHLPKLLAATLLAFSLAPTSIESASVTLVSVHVHPDRASIFPGGSFAFGAIGRYSDGSTRDLTRKAAFETSNTSIAEVVKRNAVLGVVPGAVAVTARVGEVESLPVQFEVSPITALEIFPGFDGVRLDSRIRFGANAILANGFEGLAVSSLTGWSSDAETVLGIGSGKKDSGLAEGLALGSADITAQLLPTGPSASRAIQVVDSLGSLRITPSARVTRFGEGGSFRVVGTFVGGAEAEITLDVDWFSSNPDVVSVTSKGGLKVRDYGMTTLSVRDRKSGKKSEDFGGNAELVITGPLESLSVAPAALALSVGAEQGLDALALVSLDDTSTAATDTFDWGGRVVWLSSDPAIASVDADGTMRCESAGAAEISVRDRRTGIISTETSDDASIQCS